MSVFFWIVSGALRRQARKLGSVFILILCCAPVAQAQLTTSVNGIGTGVIPDNAPGAPLIVSFDVGAVADIKGIQIDLDITHPWAGDLSATLQAPNGDSHLIFHRTGSNTGTDAGDNSDFGGLYVFSDGLPTLGNLWAVAAAQISTGVILPGVYRTVTAGGDPRGNGVDTSITSSFAKSYAAGTWTVTVSDNATGDTGAVNAASLRITHNLKSLTTTFVAGLAASGNAFNITAKASDIVVRSLDIHLSGSETVKVFMKTGSYIGNLTNAGLWTEIASEALTGVGGIPTPIEIADVTIPAGQSAAFVVHIEGGTGIQYTAGAGTYANTDFSLFSDIGLASNAPFTWADFNQPRTWNGTVYYTLGEDDASCYVSSTASGQAFTFCL